MEDPIDGRTAFQLCLIQQRKDKNRITCLAVDDEGLRFYVGLDSGYIEEHRVVYGPNGCITRVCARRQASKKVWVYVHSLSNVVSVSKKYFPSGWCWNSCCPH